MGPIARNFPLVIGGFIGGAIAGTVMISYGSTPTALLNERPPQHNAIPAKPAVSARPATPTSVVAQATLAPKPTQETGTWDVSSSQDALDRRKRIVASVRSTNSISNVIGFKQPAQLILRCDGGKFEAYVTWPSFLGVEAVDVRYRIGESPIRSASWDISTDGTAAFINNPTSFVTYLYGQRELVVGMSSWGKTEQSVTFDVTGIENVIKRLQDGCTI